MVIALCVIHLMHAFIPLSPNNIDTIVFWTKNSLPIHKYLKDIDNLGYKYYFQYTITPYKKDMEENLLDKKIIIDSFQELSRLPYKSF